LTAAEAERLLHQAGFALVRTKGSHRVYLRGEVRVVVPFHGHRILHPKIVLQVLAAIKQA
jgi:predicted RNA binding protein YcfA (HicA-like mRNA interferase family)